MKSWFKSDLNSICNTHPSLCFHDLDLPLQGHPPPHPVVSHPSSTVSFSPLPVGRPEWQEKMCYKTEQSNTELISVGKVRETYLTLTICSTYSFPAWITSKALFFCSGSRRSLYALSTAWTQRDIRVKSNLCMIKEAACCDLLWLWTSFMTPQTRHHDVNSAV